MTLHPRKVRGGLRIAWAGVSEPKSGIAQRVLDLARQAAAPEDFAEGLDYARRGQAVSAEIEGGLAAGVIQGRADRPYSTALRFSPIPDEAWRAAAAAMAGQAIYAARLLAGEIPDQLDSLFVASGGSLVPRAQDIQMSCTCGHSSGWCKHACTLAAIVADRIDHRPFLLFELRGHLGETLLEALRERAGQGTVTAVARPVYEAHVPSAPTARGRPLAECIESYWEAGPELDTIPTPIAPPPVTHPLLRRLGPSPFKEWRFPLLGLLPTCYDVISATHLDRDEDPQEGSTNGEANAGGL
jgi:uncharacterized Zn finger protein